MLIKLSYKQVANALFRPILRTGSNDSLKRFDPKEGFTFGNQTRACKDYHIRQLMLKYRFNYPEVTAFVMFESVAEKLSH